MTRYKGTLADGNSVEIEVTFKTRSELIGLKPEHKVDIHQVAVIGSSEIVTEYKGHDLRPNESFCMKQEGFDQVDYIKVLYAATCYYDLACKVNPNLYSELLIQTTKDADTAEALEATGLWQRVTAEHHLFGSFSQIAPELM